MKPINETRNYHVYRNTNGYTLVDTRLNIEAKSLDEAIAILERYGYVVIRKYSTELYKQIVVE